MKRVLGTKNYTAPEYLKNNAGSNRSDIFSLGVIVYEMLTGSLPYSKELTTRNVHKVKYLNATDKNDQVPAWIDSALRKAVSINPEQRYSLLSEFIYDLEHPNQNFAQQHRQPLIDRHPVGFWRTLSIVFFLNNSPGTDPLNDELQKLTTDLC